MFDVTEQIPHFMDNEEWYIFDAINWRYLLTEKGESIPEVKKSYDDFYALED